MALNSEFVCDLIASIDVSENAPTSAIDFGALSRSGPSVTIKSTSGERSLLTRDSTSSLADDGSTWSFTSTRSFINNTGRVESLRSVADSTAEPPSIETTPSADENRELVLPALIINDSGLWRALLGEEAGDLRSTVPLDGKAPLVKVTNPVPLRDSNLISATVVHVASVSVSRRAVTFELGRLQGRLPRQGQRKLIIKYYQKSNNYVSGMIAVPLDCLLAVERTL